MENQENMSENKEAGFVHLLKAAAAKQVKTAALAQSLTCLDAEALESLSSKWDWSKLSASHDIAWSADLIRQFEDQWKWKILSANSGISWSTELLDDFEYDWDWKILSARTDLPWSFELIHEFENKWKWNILSANIHLPWTTKLVKYFEKSWSKKILSNNPAAQPYLPENTDYSDNITVWFTQSGKNGADRPNLFDFSEEELADLRTCIKLVVSFDKDMGHMDDYPDAKIMSIEIIYDGVSVSHYGEGMGYSFDEDDGKLYGNPGPIIRFQLNQVVNIESFQASVRYLFFKFTNAHLREHTGEDAHYADCFKSEIISNSELVEYWDSYIPPEEFCGKVFHFPDGMPEGGCVLAGTDFILERESWTGDADLYEDEDEDEYDEDEDE